MGKQSKKMYALNLSFSVMFDRDKIEVHLG